MMLRFGIATLTVAWCRELSSFVSNDRLYCAEDEARAAEAALALKKASPIGGLFNQTFVVVGANCASRGYTIQGSADACTPIKVFFKTQEDAATFETSKHQTLSAWASRWGVGDARMKLMYACTCQPGSPLHDSAEGCESLETVQSGWVHQNPANGDLMMCDGGPFVFNTWTLATLKGSPQLAMHFRDQIAPVPCSQLGFPYVADKPDHCYPANKIWTRTADIATDPDIAECVATESNLTSGDPSGFEIFAKQQGFGDMEVLKNQLGCNCLEESEVGQSLIEWCKTQKHSPTRDWWNGTFPQSSDTVV